MKNKWISVLVVGLTLGTAWAVRGQFGHEQGAALAGGIGAMALVLVAKRNDWHSKMLTIALSSAVGWGAGGMISYGLVVGYGRSGNLPNALYGLLMLFVIGGLFGLLGGGLTGLSLEGSEKNRVRWGSLLAEMSAGGIIVYYFLVHQLEILMTPPRSEAWSVCLGAGLAMLWHMARNSYKSSLRVALTTALGTGFGFAFGNFIQILGNVLEVNFNMWNVMEYSIGFFGGISLTYSIFTSEWPEESLSPEPWENIAALILVFVFIPAVIFSQSMTYGTLLKRFENLADPECLSLVSSITGLFIFICIAVAGVFILKKNRHCFGRREILQLFAIVFAAYIMVSYIVTGAFAGKFHLNHHLYWVNFFIILILIHKQLPALYEYKKYDLNGRKLALYFAAIVVVITLLALIVINIHGEMSGAHNRFPSEY